MNNRIYIESDIVKKVSHGDSGAFGDLVNRLMKPAYFHALALLGNHEDAVEVSQKSFIKVWNSRKRMDPERPFYPWFYTILKRLCLNLHRDRSRKKEDLMSSFSTWIELEASEGNPSDLIIEQEQKKMIEESLSRLSMDDREIIVLKDLEGYSYKEIAGILDIPIGTVMSRLYTARKRFKTEMEVAGYEHT